MIPFHDRFRRTILLLFLALLIISCISPPYPRELVLHHIPTVITLFLLAFSRTAQIISRTSFVLILCFMLIHVLGARYLYSYVPYDEWMQALFGQRLSDMFGWKRNHYDRLVHVAYGLLCTYPAYEAFRRRFVLRRALAIWMAIGFIMASSMAYELIEWLVAVVLSPEAAEAYNGQQGDLWDAHKDMALALAGSVICILAVIAGRYIYGRKKRK